MPLEVVTYRPVGGGKLQAVWQGEFYTRAPEAEILRQSALLLAGTGRVSLTLLNRGPRLLEEGEYLNLNGLRQLEKPIPLTVDIAIDSTGTGHFGRSLCEIRVDVKTSKDGNSQAAEELVGELLKAIDERHWDYNVKRPRAWKFHTLEGLWGARAAACPVPPAGRMPVDAGASPGYALLVGRGEEILKEDDDLIEELRWNPGEEEYTFLEAHYPPGEDECPYLHPGVRLVRLGRPHVNTEYLRDASVTTGGRYIPVRIRRRGQPHEAGGVTADGSASHGSTVRTSPALHLHARAVWLAGGGAYGRALPLFKEAWQEATEGLRPLVVRNMVLCLLHLGRYRDALELAADGLAMYPQYTDLAYLKGLTLLRAGEARRAEAQLFACVDLGEPAWWHYSDRGSGSYKPAFALGRIYAGRGDLQNAVTAMVGSLSHNPRFLPALAGLRKLPLSPGDFSQVARVVEGLIDVNDPATMRVWPAQFRKGGEAR